MSNVQLASRPSINSKEPSQDVPSYLLAVLSLVTAYATGQIAYGEYIAQLDAWWQQYKDAWQENDLSHLFRLICLTN